jgi:predicted house-cleaning noncanonical NTP pyrophosphatase (MazG superfamily)
MCKIKTFNKLVKDKIPEIISAKGSKHETEILNDENYLKSLHEKLFEEYKEVAEAIDEKSKTEELADVMEVFFAIGGSFGITAEKIEKIRLNQRKAWRFERRIF